MKDIKVSLNDKILVQNIQNIRSKMPTDCKLCAVVKCNAYGHGINAVCKIIYKYADYFAVANNFEAVHLKRKFLDKNILVLGGLSTYYLRPAIKLGIEITVSSIDELTQLQKTAQKLNKQALIHLKVNTGMNRIGIDCTNSMRKILNILPNLPNIKLVGIYSHLGEGENLKRTNLQIEKFNNFLAYIPDGITKHLCNSTFYLNKSSCYDMVRVGIGLYGYDFPDVNPCLQIDARIVEIKSINKGDYIGYGNKHKAKRNMKIATLSIGYGEGLIRQWANGGYVLINGKKAKFCANICMDMSMVDITEIDANINDYATILGKNGNNEITANAIAKVCNTIPYEILTNFKKINR